MGYGRGYGYDGYGGGMMSNGGWFVGLLLTLFGVLVILVVVLLVVWAVRASSGHGHSGAVMHPMTPGATPPTGAVGHDEAVAIAKKRLASGEIKPDEYAEIMRHLGG